MFLSTQIIFLSFLLITVKVSSMDCKYRRWSGCSSEEEVKVKTPSDTDAKKVSIVKLYHGIIELLRKRNKKKHNLEDKQDQIKSGNINWLRESRIIGATEKRGKDQQQLQLLQEQILKQQQEQLLRQEGKRKQQQKLQKEEQKQKSLVELQQMMLQLLQKQKQLKKDRKEKLLELQFLLLQQRQIEKLQLQYQQNN
ncbi:serum response factor homolog A-like [Hydractinia symbiolongicarpus]|uniref:serum response factor homolog A-like n=1 Tax=Hydractinia symbiolongicarpus TaxID=13093 RepID=UPI00254C5394|nr:serum response factor homolog A-like [Hydractinia symbiolongicarpus]